MAAVSPITILLKAIDQASPTLKNLVGEIQSQFVAVGVLTGAYNQIEQTIQKFAQTGAKAYNLLIGQNVELQNQLLSTQASLVATNKIISQGVEIKDPTQAIQALTEPVNEAVTRLREGSLELVGVTSNDLIPLFQLTAQNSANIGASLQDSSDLALSFAAALGTLKIPLDQARQELTSIYTAQITSDSQLAKSLGLNNQMVNQWKAQGVLVERLNERLGAFRAGNALAAQTIDGVASNIQELIDEVGRIAGAPLLEPIVAGLDSVYKFLQANKDAIQAIATDVVNFFLDVGAKLGEAVKAVAPAVEQIANALFTQLSAEASAAGNVINLLVDGLVALVKVSTPLLQIIATLADGFAKIASSDLGGLALQAGLVLGILTQFTPLLLGIQAGFVKAAAGAILFGNAAKGGKEALFVLKTLSPTLAAVATSYAAAGGGALGFAAALGTATAAAKAFVLSMAPILPFLAAGAVFTLAVVTPIETGKLKDVNESLEIYRQQNELISDQSLKTAASLKALNDAEKANGTLTEEQTKKRERLQKTAANQVDAIKSQIATLKELKPVNEAQKNTQEAQIKQLERQIGLLQKLSGGTRLQARDLEVLGNAYQQLQKKVADTQAQFDQGGGGDSARFQESAKQLVALTQRQLELGLITSAEAEKRLAKVRDDGRVEFEVQLQAQEAITKARQAQTDRRVKAAENEQQQIQRLIANEEISQAEGQARISANKIKQLQIQLDATRQAIAEETRLREQQTQQQLQAIDKEIEAAQKRRDAAAGKGDKGETRLANADIARLQAQRQSISESLKIESAKQTQLKAQEAKFASEIAQTKAQERQRLRQQELKDFDEQQAILDARRANGLVSQEQFNKQSLSIAIAKGNAELKQIDEQRKKLNAKDKEGLEALAAQEAAVRKRQADAVAANQEQQVALIEQSQKKALDAIAQSEAERSLEIAELRNQDAINSAEAEKLKIDATRDRIQEELRLEQEKLSQLQALPKFLDPQKEEQRQSQIRGSQLKTAQLTKSLIDNEIQQRDAVFAIIQRRIDREIQGIQNVATAQTQALEQQARLGDLATKSLDIQFKLLEARKGVVSSVSNFLQGQLDILKETAESEEEKAQLAERQADIRLKTVREQARIEREVLELNLEQNRAALEQEKIQNRIEQIKARAATLTAQAEQQKVEADPNANEVQKEAARLRTQAAAATEGALAAQSVLLEQRGSLIERDAERRRSTQQFEQELADNQARLELAKSRVDENQGRREIEQLRDGLKARRFDSYPVDFRIGFRTQTEDIALGERLKQSLSVSQFLAAMQGNLGAIPINQSLPQSQFQGAVTPSQIQVGGGVQPVPQPGAITVNISNTFSPSDVNSGQAAQKVSEQIRKEMYDVFNLVAKR